MSGKTLQKLPSFSKLVNIMIGGSMSLRVEIMIEIINAQIQVNIPKQATDMTAIPTDMVAIVENIQAIKVVTTHSLKLLRSMNRS